MVLDTYLLNIQQYKVRIKGSQDLTLNNVQELICDKTKPTNQPTNQPTKETTT